ncbi:unnamed protein product [Rotaria sordida]|uniref:Uncharacterized protein n=1 Tax=Rotaria sordida TaxID=392033 RepID=A0A818PZI9_9BILA|nr:unnamed protein product [Rotaria sordida]CAF3629029.1 unnamed protein product [Rotaria sordida]CAF3718838.1 unnamed protein product [Rotaria sordida]
MLHTAPVDILHLVAKSPCRRSETTLSYFRLIEFTLFAHYIEFIINDIKSILNYMPALIKLTLSIRDTHHPIFCEGPKLESILNKHLPHLHQFVYTMTHEIHSQTLIEDFIQWPMDMVFYEDDNSRWIHIYSLPWPSNKDDKRRLPLVNNGYNTTVTSNTHFRRACQIKTCLLIDIKLPTRITKLILTEEAHITSETLVVQTSICHLTVERRLINEREISILAHHFPNVTYLKLLFTFEKSLYIRCFQTLFSVDNNINGNRCFWPQLINFSTDFYNELNIIMDDNDVKHWLIQNTDMKFCKSQFYADCFNSTFHIWF